MSMRENIVNKAKSYLGYTEGPNNDTIFGNWYGLPNQPWCAMFVSYVLNECGVSQSIVPKFASCTTGFNKFNEMRIATREHITPRPGDIIFFIWKQGEPTPDHVGLVEKVENGRVYTIEGNRSDKVQEFNYDLNNWEIYGYATPTYEENEEPVVPSNNEPVTSKIAEDGLWGKDTTKKAQEVFGTPVDGIVSNQYAAYSNSNKGLLASTFDWKNNPSKNGSVLIKAIQQKIGVIADGFIGPATIKAMQKWLGTPVDGVVSYPSVMVKAFQKWLNEQ